MTHPIREQAVRGFKPGDTLTCTRTFTRRDTEQFGDLTRDYNPVHYDSTWTDQKGFDDLICHGLLVGSMICEFGGQAAWLATGMNFKFIAPVYFNDTIECRITITTLEENGRAEAEAVFTNQEGRQVCLASLTGRLPVDKERKTLDAIIRDGDLTNKL